MSIKYQPISGSVDLNSFIIYSAISLQPNNDLIGGLSGLFRLGYEPKVSQDLSYNNSSFIEGGLGKTYGLTRDFDLYCLGVVGYQSGKESIFHFTPTIGGVMREIFSMKTVLNLSQSFESDQIALSNFNISQIYNSSNYALALKYFLNKKLQSSSSIEQIDGFEISAKYFF